jgi:16S rRNA (guanine966-N2)-methyltransferase
MRVIAGQFRHRKLVAPEGLDTRPILDRVKTALFDWLGARLALPGQLPPIRVLDLFSGAGSLGIEALSRGASYCAFVESDAAALDFLRRNLSELHIGSIAQIHGSPAETAALNGAPKAGFDLVFLDPPYRLSHEYSTGTLLDRVIQRLGRNIPVAADALLVWRHDRHDELPDLLGDGWRQVERRDWGTMAITLYQRISREAS